MARRLLGWLGLGLALAAPAPALGAGCKLALVIGLDISSSVNEREYAIQQQGLARAFRTPAIVEAILAPEGSAIAVLVYEWSGYNQQDVIQPWVLLDSPAAIARLADRLAAQRRLYSDLTTALGKSVEYAAGRFDSAPPCVRRVVDLSGDGANNDGPGPEEYRDRGLLDGLVINGLAIQGAVPDPAEYYRDHVIQGPGAFLAVARDFDDYPSAIIGKLLREIEQEEIIGQAEWSAR